MQEYKRQIAYLCAYERGEQLRSTGFVKAEERGGHCRLALHLRGYCHPGEAAGNVYIYFYHQDRTIGIYLGALKNQNGALEWQGELDAEDILGKGIRFADTHGIWVKRPGGRDYVAEWDDYPVDTKRFVLYPEGGIRCICCPWFGRCEKSGVKENDRRREIYEGSTPAGKESGETR